MPVFTSIGLALGSTVAASAAGVGAFGVGVAAVGAAGAAVGYSQYSASQGRQATKSAKHDADVANQQAIAESSALKAKSASQAKESILSRQRAMARNKTTFTSPLGLKDEAATITKTLTGQ